MQTIIPDKCTDMRRETLLAKLVKLKKIKTETECLENGTNNRELRLQAINAEILKIARELEYFGINQ